MFNPRLLLILALSACGSAGEGPPNLELASEGSASAGRGAEVTCAIGLGLATRLRGRLERRVHLGPPGYGESPTIDTRDTSWIVLLPAALPPCDATDESADSARREVQLVVPPANVHELLGETIEVHGRLGQASLGWQRTPFVIFIDSVPSFRQLAARRTQIG